MQMTNREARALQSARVALMRLDQRRFGSPHLAPREATHFNHNADFTIKFGGVKYRMTSAQTGPDDAVAEVTCEVEVVSDIARSISIGLLLDSWDDVYSRDAAELFACVQEATEIVGMVRRLSLRIHEGLD